MINTICKKCGKCFLVKESKLMNGRGKFCSLNCRNNSYKKDYDSDYFWSRVNKKSEDECWDWLGNIRNGYGIYTRSRFYAHRKAYEFTYGSFTVSMHVLHKYDNPICCNPKHLFLGNNQDNINDKVNKNRQLRGENHPNSKLNVYQIKFIRKYSNMYSFKCLAKMFSVDYHHISDIIKNKRWKSVSYI